MPKQNEEEQDGKVIGVKLPSDVAAALDKYRDSLRDKGDPMLSGAQAARVLLIDGLRRSGHLKKDGK